MFRRLVGFAPVQVSGPVPVHAPSRIEPVEPRRARQPDPGLHADDPTWRPPSKPPVQLARLEDRVAAALDYCATVRLTVAPEVAVAFDDLALLLRGGGA